MKKALAIIGLFLIIFTPCPGYASSYPLQSGVSHYQRYNMTDEQRDSALKTLELEEKREEKRREGRDIRWTSKTEQEFDKQQTQKYHKTLLLAIAINVIIYAVPFYIFRCIRRQPLNKLVSFFIICLYSVTANVVICYIIYGFYLSGSYPPWLWMILAYYFLVAKQPILVPKSPIPEPPEDWKDY